MKKQYSMIALCLAMFAGSAFAAGDSTGKSTASGATPKARQQTKMGTCSKEAKAKGLHKAERKEFMSNCLKAKA